MIAELITGGLALVTVAGFAIKAMLATSRVADARVSEQAAIAAMKIAQSREDDQRKEAVSQKARADELQRIVNRHLARGNVVGAYDELLADLQAMHTAAPDHRAGTVSDKGVGDPDALMRPDE